MTTISSPQRPERRGIRYPLDMPVLLKLAHREVHTRSQNISLGGILLSSAFLVPEGSRVEVAVEVAPAPHPGTQLSARGKVLRVHPKATGGFAVAIAFDRPFELGFEALNAGSTSQPRFPEAKRGNIETHLRSTHVQSTHVRSVHVRSKTRIIPVRGLHLAAAWHTET
jgi:hypothetical protein